MTSLTAELDEAISQAVAGLRETGYSWTEIAARLGVTRQAAQQRWARSQVAEPIFRVGKICVGSPDPPLEAAGRDEAEKGETDHVRGFTEQARHVVVEAQKEAKALNRHDVGTGVILVALSHEGTGVSARALASLGITEEAARQQDREIIAPDQPLPPHV